MHGVPPTGVWSSEVLTQIVAYRFLVSKPGESEVAAQMPDESDEDAIDEGDPTTRPRRQRCHHGNDRQTKVLSQEGQTANGPQRVASEVTA